MEHEELEHYRDATVAARIVREAVKSGMAPLQVCVALGVSATGPSTWESGKVKKVRATVARRLRRLERRIGRKA